VKTTRHPKRKESGGGKQQTLFPMKSSKSKDVEKEEAETEESMVETPTPIEDMEIESEELQEAQAPSIVGDSLVCLLPLSYLLLSILFYLSLSALYSLFPRYSSFARLLDYYE
jgi:hypothetical protein